MSCAHSHRSEGRPKSLVYENIIKAGRVLELRQGRWKGQAVGSNEFVISSDEKTEIQARVRPPRQRLPAAIDSSKSRSIFPAISDSEN